MVVPLEEFIKRLEDSGIISGDTIKNFVPPNASPKGAEELAFELVRNNKLTKYQAAVVYSGDSKPLVLGNYILMEKIGAGGMGQVFKAKHQRMDRMVALKLLPASMAKDTEAISRFEREVRAAAKISHPNIVAAHDADCADGVHFLVMELVQGSDLSALVKQNGPFPVEKVIDFIVQAATGLEAAHKKGVVHRDIKPSNLLLDADGTIKILDMGLAILKLDEAGYDSAKDELTTDGKIMGTVDFMSPEQALNTHTVDARTDIYALGCTMFYLLTGKPTYAGNTPLEKLMAHRVRPIPSLRAIRPEIPAKLDDVFKKMIAKRVSDRYQTATDLIEALNAVRNKSSETSKSTGLSTDEIFPDLTSEDLAAQSSTALPEAPSTRKLKALPSGKKEGKPLSSKSLNKGGSGKGKKKSAPSEEKSWLPVIISCSVLVVVLVAIGIFALTRPGKPVDQAGTGGNVASHKDGASGSPKSKVQQVDKNQEIRVNPKTKVITSE